MELINYQKNIFNLNKYIEALYNNTINDIHITGRLDKVDLPFFPKS